MINHEDHMTNGSNGMRDYDDIINLPHPVSRKHPQMSMMARAAQFAPFAALTGYDAAISEAAKMKEETDGGGEDSDDFL